VRWITLREEPHSCGTCNDEVAQCSHKRVVRIVGLELADCLGRTPLLWGCVANAENAIHEYTFNQRHKRADDEVVVTTPVGTKNLAKQRPSRFEERVRKQRVGACPKSLRLGAEPLNHRLRDFSLWSVGPAIELYPSRDEAERALVDVLRDEPQWEGRFSIEVIELGSWSRTEGHAQLTLCSKGSLSRDCQLDCWEVSEIGDRGIRIVVSEPMNEVPARGSLEELAARVFERLDAIQHRGLLRFGDFCNSVRRVQLNPP
jgi:hypothetical protein